MDNLSQSTRLIIACAISAIIIGFWDMYFVKPMRVSASLQAQAQNKVTAERKEAEIRKLEILPRDIALTKATRAPFENAKIKGSINLKGAVIDDLVLKSYSKELDKNSGAVELLSPTHTDSTNLIKFGWLKSNNYENIELPNAKTIWTLNESSTDHLIQLSWTNKANYRFYISINIDEDYMFDIKQVVQSPNKEEQSKLTSYATISRVAPKRLEANAVIHEGAIAVDKKKLQEIAFKEIAEDKPTYNGDLSWLGFSDKYWLTAIIPAQHSVQKAEFTAKTQHAIERYNASVYNNSSSFDENNKNISSFKIFAGAKELAALDKYTEGFNITLFDRAIDFGFLYFITKPLFLVLQYFYGFLGNFGIAILLLTVGIKILLFPLAHKGFKGMNRLKDLQPKMEELKKKHGDEPQAFQRALLEMYQKEKVNPMSGCLPILLQIPVFFALYKVLYVSIEMRHAPFFGWIKDLSAPDPTTIFNLFGLIPWDPPSFLMVGIFPLLMSITMFLQQKLSPEPTDPTQAMVMKLMPWMFLFMFSSFPSGLVIYWAWSNTLSIAQQMLIKKMEGKPRKSKK